MSNEPFDYNSIKFLCDKKKYCISQQNNYISTLYKIYKYTREKKVQNSGTPKHFCAAAICKCRRGYLYIHISLLAVLLKISRAHLLLMISVRMNPRIARVCSLSGKETRFWTSTKAFYLSHSRAMREHKEFRVHAEIYFREFTRST